MLIKTIKCVFCALYSKLEVLLNIKYILRLNGKYKQKEMKMNLEKTLTASLETIMCVPILTSRGRDDSRNILVVVMCVNDNSFGFYRLGTSEDM